MSLDQADERRIEELFGRYVEQHVVHGVLPDPEELCQGEPELLETLRQCIREYDHLGQILAPPRDLAPGRTLLHYRIVEQIGAGGMGQVYVAEDTKLGRRVALKVLPPETADEPERLERFRREARIVAALNHPNIVTLFSVEEADGIHFLTMELVEGKTLAALVAEDGGLASGGPLESSGAPPATTLLEIARQLADALVAAHARGIVHRDLKPANVIVGSDGRLKVLDFGLAKLRPAADGAGTGLSATLAQTLSVEGRVLGTLPYMSPEQVQGFAVDARTDLFSFGSLLYEMATGRRPFRGHNMAELISAILRDTPEPMTDLRSDVPELWEPIVRRCLEKDPKARFQSALELRAELSRLEEAIRSGELRPMSSDAGSTEPGKRAEPRPRPSGRRLAGSAAAVLAVLLLTFGVWWTSRESGEPRTVSEEAGVTARPSLAVLYFDNLTGDPELDWLSRGITEMLVTDLTQSPEIDVLSTSRLYQVLSDLDALEQPTLSLELIRKVAREASVEVVARGSYARLGDVFRVTFTLERAATGTPLKSKSVEGRGEESLFALVDELSAAVRNNFEVARPAESAATVRAVTTSSLEAWHFFTEARAFSHQSKRSEAIALLERAVEMDPNFALALVYLANLHRNLAHTAQAREYSRRAFELADRLPLDERYRIEGAFYSTTWATYDRAIEAYLKGLRLHPDDWTDLRSSLAYRYAELERYEEAIEEFDRNVADGSTYVGNYTLAADAYAALGRFETGYRLLADLESRQPDNWQVQLKMGWLLIEWGRFEDAARHLERAAGLRPFNYVVPYGRWRLQVRRGDLVVADAEAAHMADSDDPNGRWRGAVSRARNLTYRGRTKEALVLFDEAIQAIPTPDAFSALTRCWKAELLLQRDEPGEALVEARLAQEEGRDEFPELKGLYLAALAEQRLGRPGAAQAIEKTLGERWKSHPNKVEERQLHHLSGLLALERGDAEDAVRALTRAEALLPPTGIEIAWHVYPDHVPIWFALGQAEQAAGRSQEALRWFRRAASASEHVEQPVPFVRSFYFLGHIYQQSGETNEARQSFERFLRYWQEGDVDRHRVEEALAAVRSGA